MAFLQRLKPAARGEDVDVRVSHFAEIRAPSQLQQLLRAGPQVELEGGSIGNAARCLSSGGVFKDFVNKVKEEVDKNPDLKQSVDALKKQADTFKESTEGLKQQAEKVQEKSKEAASKMSEQRQQFSESASRVGSSLGSKFTDTAEQMKSAFQEGLLGGMKRESPAGNTTGASSTGEEEPGSGSSTGTDAGARAEPKAEQPKSAFASRLSSAWTVMAKEVKEVFIPPTEVQSAMARPDAAPIPEGDPNGPSELINVKPSQSEWQKRFGFFRAKVEETSVYQQVQSHVDKVRDSQLGKNVVERATQARTKYKNVKEDLLEKWETSDSAVVQGIQDTVDSVSGDSDRSAAMRVVRQRDMVFDMVTFLQGVKSDVVPVMKAYLSGDVEQLKQVCSSELAERCLGQHKYMTQEGQVIDTTILDIDGDLDLIDVQLMQGQPVVVLRFSLQQINCVCDKHGNIIDGAPDDVQRVYYLWAMEQESAGIVDVNGKVWPPRWILKEMQLQGMHKLL